jgi:hypothetical protein
MFEHPVARKAVTLEERLLLMEDRLALLQLEAAYSSTYDSGNGEGWAALFTEDGIYEGRQREGMPEQNYVQGRHALAAFCISDPLRGSCIHCAYLPDFTIGDDSAVGRIPFAFRRLGYNSHGQIFRRDTIGNYDTAYVKTTTGWKIRHRFTVVFEKTQSSFYGYEPDLSPFSADEPHPDGAPYPYRDQRWK